MKSNWKSHTLPVEMYNGGTSLRTVSQFNKANTFNDLSTRYLSKRNEHASLCNDLYSNVLGNFIYNNQRLDIYPSVHPLGA